MRLEANGFGSRHVTEWIDTAIASGTLAFCLRGAGPRRRGGVSGCWKARPGFPESVRLERRWPLEFLRLVVGRRDGRDTSEERNGFLEPFQGIENQVFMLD